MTATATTHPLDHALIEHSLDLIAALDERGVILFQSRSAERILGYTPEQLVGRNGFDLIHPDDRARVLAVFQQGREQPGPRGPVEYRFLHRNGSWRTLESVGSSVALENGGRIGIVNSRDITDHRVLQDRYHHAQRVATVGHIAGALVHEFRNSLQIMLLSLDDLLESNAAPHLAPELEGIKRAGDLAAVLARQVLDLSRSGTSTPQRVDVNDAVRTLAPLLQKLAGKRIQLRTELRATDALVRARFGAFDQLLINLITNARDAIRENGHVTITTRTVRDRLVLEVHDDGIGIPIRLQDRIFEPYFTTKSASAGTGLGLSTIREIVEDAGGTITVHSAIGCGATFTISWPLPSAAFDHDAERECPLPRTGTYGSF